MSILIIDSHNAAIPTHGHVGALNLHLRNSMTLANLLDADLVTLPKHLTRLRNKHYDKVIFVHASAYSKHRHFVSFLKHREVQYYYVLNEYNLGESHTLWGLCRDYGKKFHVIANHAQQSTGKIVPKNVLDWHVLNLNTLIFDESIPMIQNPCLKNDILYYGAFRKDRLIYFHKWFDSNFPVSTSKKNVEKFRTNNIQAHWLPPLRWLPNNIQDLANKWQSLDIRKKQPIPIRDTLYEYKAVLYLEDEHTHTNYNYLANRFYEALSYWTPCFFDESCINTITKSGYPIKDFYVVNTKRQLTERLKRLDPEDTKQYMKILRKKASAERHHTFNQLKEILT